ncbi:30S ribosomal protein S2 [bacterium]|nr:30S ribosomal protein S2 [bacterium]|tara:strand:+ start:2666 stop:3352 length:687 start_codon:yes stop_codon:yes gene_type:complete
MYQIKDKNAELKNLLENAVHFGHYTNKWNPKMKPFIHGSKQRVHIIDLHQTIKYMESTFTYLQELRKGNKTILLVSTKQQSIPLVEKLAEASGQPFVTNKWIPGLLTNFNTIKSRTDELKRLKQMRDNGELAKYTKKEQSKLGKLIIKLESNLGGVENMPNKPDAIFVLDSVRDAIAVKEARTLGIPVVGFIDTNTDPDLIDFPIPANDDAIKSLTYMLSKVEEILKK